VKWLREPLSKSLINVSMKSAIKWKSIRKTDELGNEPCSKKTNRSPSPSKSICKNWLINTDSTLRKPVL
jgi:hypothetical protein